MGAGELPLRNSWPYTYPPKERWHRLSTPCNLWHEVAPLRLSPIDRLGANALTGIQMKPAPAGDSGKHGVEDFGIVSEIPTWAGVLLWETLRDVTTWLGTPRERRLLVFADGTPELRVRQIEEEGLEEELRAPLLVLAGITALDTRKVEEAEVGAACLALARYAEERGAPATRLAFAKAAAVAMPDDARLAFEVGKLARDSADYVSGESWFRKAIKTAIRVKDRETYILGYMGLAVLYMRLGNYPASYAFTGRAIRAAQHYRMRDMAGRAFHHLFILDARSGRVRQAYEHVRSAHQAYGDAHERLPVLAHDVARFWIEQGRCSRALPVFEAVLSVIGKPEEQALVAANIAWAAAGVGTIARYKEARRHALNLLSYASARVRASETLALLAFADAYAGEWDIAEKMAELALQNTIERRESDIQVLAELALSYARSCDPGRSRKEEEMPTLARQADRLAGELIRALSQG